MFYSYINRILIEKLDVFIIIYLDDIFIYTESKKKIRESYLISIRLITKILIICQS